MKKGDWKKSLAGCKGQVWIETVIYLLIALVMISLVLAFVKPKIEELRDQAIIDQSIEILKNIDNSILTMGEAGNKRVLEIGIKKGTLTIDSVNDNIIFEIDSRYLYTEVGQTVNLGNIQATTEDKGKNNLVTLKRDFSEEYNLTYKGEENAKTFPKSSTPYTISLTNKGEFSNKIKIDFDIQ